LTEDEIEMVQEDQGPVIKEDPAVEDETDVNPQDESVPEPITPTALPATEDGVGVEEDDECPQCQVVELMAVMGMAHTSCQLVDDPKKRDACIAWSEALDPELIDNIGDVAAGIVEHAGIEGISEYAKLLNTKMSDAVIEYVQTRLDAGTVVTDAELSLYKAMVVKRGV